MLSSNSSCVTLGKLFDFSVSRLPYPGHGMMDVFGKGTVTIGTLVTAWC
jgi:hypothetical protein